MLYIITVILTYQTPSGEDIRSVADKYYYEELLPAMRRAKLLREYYSDTALITVVRSKEPAL